MVPLVSTTIVGIALLTYDALAVQRRQLEQNLQREGENYAALAARTLSPMVEMAPAEQLHEQLSYLAQVSRAKVRILDADGAVIHSSAMEEEGRQSDADLVELARRARRGLPASKRSGNDLIVAVAPLGQSTFPRVLAMEIDQSGPLGIRDANRRQVIAVAATWMILLNLVVLVVLRVLVHQPVMELRHKISRARRGDWRVTVSFAERRDEIGELGTDFNDMVRQLRENCQQCEHLHNVHMQQAAHMASVGELAAGLAHEIKNPLAGIAGAIDIIREELPPDHANRAILSEVQNECRRIKKTIANLLRYATPQPPNLLMRDLQQTLEHALLMIEHLAEAGSVKLVREFDPDLPTLPHDQDQIEQVFRNLLLNALEATDKGGEIHVSTRLLASPGSRTPPAAEVIVADTGAGMAPDQVARIFKPFFTTKQSGSGLGLAVSKRIVDQHGGTILVESELGRGTRFIVRLPAVPMHEKVFTLV